jgi:homogentisate 1,2-dioxygenase
MSVPPPSCVPNSRSTGFSSSLVRSAIFVSKTTIRVVTRAPQCRAETKKKALRVEQKRIPRATRGSWSKGPAGPHGVYAGHPLLPQTHAQEPFGQDTLLVKFVQHSPDGTSSICHSALHQVDWMGPCSTYPV